ncbi:MAG: hypothetical protein ACE5E1_00540 [Phycisphaerae bacterium]
MKAKHILAAWLVLFELPALTKGATWVKGLVPDWNQPYWHGANGPNGGPGGGPPGPWQFWCTPTSAANVLGYWEDHRGQPVSDGAVAPASGTVWPNWPAWQDYEANGAGTRGTLSPAAADDIGWYMDTNRAGDAAFGNPAHIGTYIKDISGKDAAGQWAGLNRFFRDRGATGFRARTQGPGYADPGLPILTTAEGWTQITREIDADRPMMVAFFHWVLQPPMGSNADASPEGSLGWDYHNFVPGGGTDPWGNGEVWNDYDITGLALGHVVTVVGYIPANSPDDILGNTNWVIVHDNVGQTPRNVAVPFNAANWLANTRITGYSDSPYAFGQPEVVDNTGDTGRYPSLALDADGAPHISYVDWTNRDLRYATKSGGNWTLETVDSAPGYVGGTSVAMTWNGDPRIAYIAGADFNQPKDLKYAAKGVGWNLQTVYAATATTNAEGPSIVLTAQDYPRISYYRGGDELWLSEHNGFGWGHTLIDPNCPNLGPVTTFLDIDTDGYLHIAYSDYVVSGIFNVTRLKYAYNACGGWNASWIESFAGTTNISVGELSSVAVGSDGRRTLSHRTTGNELRVAQVGGSCGIQIWFRYAVDGNIAQGTTVVRYDSADRPVIAYWGACPGIPQAYACMKLARWDGGQWTIQTVYDPGGVGPNNYWLSMDLDVYNRPHIAFYGPDAATLRYLTAQLLGDLDGDGSVTLAGRAASRPGRVHGGAAARGRLQWRRRAQRPGHPGVYLAPVALSGWVVVFEPAMTSVPRAWRSRAARGRKQVERHAESRRLIGCIRRERATSR